MQADEDVGKIAMAVPLLVSKALELFLQDLCDRTYEITLQRGAKTLNSMHLKQCVQSFNIFDFLRDIVSKVPDLGGSDAAGEERPATKRRKLAEHDYDDIDEDSKKDNKPSEVVHANGSGRGRGRGRGRGGGRISQAEREANAAPVSSYEKHEPYPNSIERQKLILGSIENTSSKEIHISPVGKVEEMVKARNFDLNLDLDENGDGPTMSSAPIIPSDLSPKAALEMKHDEYPGWSLADVEKMAINLVKLANLNSRVNEDEEDYDEEG